MNKQPFSVSLRSTGVNALFSLIIGCPLSIVSRRTSVNLFFAKDTIKVAIWVIVKRIAGKCSALALFTEIVEFLRKKFSSTFCSGFVCDFLDSDCGGI